MQVILKVHRSKSNPDLFHVSNQTGSLRLGMSPIEVPDAVRKIASGGVEFWRANKAGSRISFVERITAQPW